MAESDDRPARPTLAARVAGSVRVPPSAATDRDRLVRARVRALAPVLATLTVAWIALDAAALPARDALAIALIRIVVAAALLLLARNAGRLPANRALRAFVWVQAAGFGAMQLLLPRAGLSAEVGYGLFPFVVVAQLALFPAPWPHTLRAALAPAAALALVLYAAGSIGAAAWRDLWLLALLTGVAAWTAQAQLDLLGRLLGARREATQDALTGLANRRRLDARLAVEHARVSRHGGAMSVLMLDLDRFKRVNDEYGHAAGDAVLAAAAHAMVDELRAVDLGGRFGGEEFLAVLPDTPLDDALRVAERIRRRVATLTTIHDGTAIVVTVSIGAAQLADGESIASLLARADAALYDAKRGGRDRCVAAPVPPSEPAA
jgi:diguanylate cyclase (GGDEF)-like protein